MSPNRYRLICLRRKGFTLIELLIAIVIVGILASIALPAYEEYVARGYITGATKAVAELRTRAEQWFADNRTYQDSTATGAGFSCAATEAPKYFTLTCTAAASATFTITANGTGRMSGYQYTINQMGAKTSTTPKSSGTCWLMKNGGTC